MNITKMIEEGYCRTSRAGGIVARIDRPDWVDFCMDQGLTHLTPGQMEDQYRRVYTQDRFQVGRVAFQFPSSSSTITGFRRKLLK